MTTPDPHIVIIGRGVLSEHIHGASSTSRHQSAGLGWLGISITLFFAAFLTESFKNIGPLMGNNLRSVAFMLSLVTLGLAINSGAKWFKKRKTHTPEGIIDRLTTSEPLGMDQIEPILALAQTQNKINRNNKKGVENK